MNSRKAHFQRLGAPLVNPAWSWGARRADGTCILCAWSDPKFGDLDYAAREVVIQRPGDTSKAGRNERDAMIAELLAGSAGYIVFMLSSDRSDAGLRIAQFNDEALFPVQSIRVRDDGVVVAKFGNPVAVREFIERRAA